MENPAVVFQSIKRRPINGIGHYSVMTRDRFGDRIPIPDEERDLTRTTAGMIAHRRSEEVRNPVFVKGRFGFPVEQWEGGQYIRGFWKRIGEVVNWLILD